MVSIMYSGQVVNCTNKLNETELMIACRKRNVNAINILLDPRVCSNCQGDEGYTYLHFAVIANCSKETLQVLVDNGAHVNAASKTNQTALFIACNQGDTDAMNTLLQARADPNICCNFPGAEGCTCLQIAVDAGCNKETLQALVDNGADVNAANKKNQTALIVACLKRYVSAINILLHAGADPNIADADGNTCLHNAVIACCNKESLQGMISHGSDVNTTNKLNETPLMLARKRKYGDAISVRLKAGSNTIIARSEGSSSTRICSIL